MKNRITQILSKARLFRHGKHEWFTGNYSTWEAARAACSGYDAPEILEKVKDSLLKVKNGEAAYERDSVLFDEIQYSLPLLSFILYVASASGNHLNLLDFGGSLGSSYFQNRKFLDRLNSLKWSIVEQPHFVAIGRELFSSENVFFFDSIRECVKKLAPNAILLSSVLPYVPEPYSILKEIADHNFDFIILDRTPFFVKDTADRLTVEHVPPSIYRAEYPAWFFNRQKMIDFLKPRYALFETLPANDTQTLADTPVEYLAMIFLRIKNA